jgi:stress response protein YsnF
MIRQIKELLGYTLGAVDGEIGRIKHFYFDDKTWVIRYLVADTGTWIPLRKVLISPHALKRLDDKQKVLHVTLTKEQIENSPSIEAHEPVSRRFEKQYYGYYAYPFYWQGAALWGMSPYPIVPPVLEEQPAEEPEEQDRHLRSTSEVAEYRIQARDGEIGHVEDFLLDDQSWAIRYLIVDTRNWWPGKKVLISPRSIGQVSWEESKVFVSLDRETIKQAPEYDPSVPFTEDYEERLRQSHERPEAPRQ